MGGELCAGDDVSKVEWVMRSSLGDHKMTEGTLNVIEEAYKKRALRKRT